jgi:hypothetical protein
MKQADKHTWIKDKDELYKHTCKTCGCIRTRICVFSKHYIHYTRSGINFSEDRPDCLDWDDNTLD